jgi:hypothetical protein
VKSLLDIWKEFRTNNDQEIKAASTPRNQPRKSSLPEPPGRELLERRIALLLEELQQVGDISVFLLT